MNDFYRMLQVLKSHPQQKFAMATIIEVIGSNYRRVGAKMLYSENNITFGTLSAGCLEEDLTHHAQNVMLTQKPHIVTYDLMSDDVLSWGENVGCNGKITIYIEAMDWQQVAKLEPFLLEGKSIIAIKCIDGEQAGTTFYTTGEIDLPKFVSTPLNLKSLFHELQEFLISEQKTTTILCPSTHCHYVFERYLPREELYIFGAGPDAEPIVSLAAQMDFAVTVIDPCDSRCNATYFPLAHQLKQFHPTTYLQNYELPTESYVLVMTHKFNWDRAIVEHILEHPVHYLGVLGPRRRTQALLPDRTLPEWLHSPVGLRIGAEGPQEISVSILAELIQERSMYRVEKRPPAHTIDSFHSESQT